MRNAHADVSAVNYFFRGAMAFTSDTTADQADTDWNPQLNLAPTILLRPGFDPAASGASEIAMTAIQFKFVERKVTY